MDLSREATEIEVPATAEHDGHPARPFGLTIVIPVYNGAATIAPLVDELTGLSVHRGHELVLVVDGSPDDSLAVCRELARTRPVPITVLNLSRNFGEHNAVMAGLAHARGDYIVTMDDDRQNPPEEVVRLYDFARSGAHDVVYTWYETKEHAWWRNLGSRLTNWLSDFLLDKPRGLYLSTFRCISAFAATEVVRHTGPFPYVDGLLLQVTQDIARLQVRHVPRAHGESNYTLRRLVRLFLAMSVGFSVMPLRVSAVIGLVTSLLGLVVIVEVVVEAMIGGTPAGWASIMAGIVLLAGIQLLMLGLIGEYLGRLFLSASRKPQYVVRDVTRH